MFNRNKLSFFVVLFVMFAIPAFAKSNTAPKMPDINSIMKPPTAMPMPAMPNLNSSENMNSDGFIPLSPSFGTMPSMPNNAEERLASFKEALKINDDQMPYWIELVNTVKYNEKAKTEDAISEKNPKISPEAPIKGMMLMPGMKKLPEELEAREKNMEMQAEGLQRLKPVLLQLYNTLNEEQKITADQQFSMYLGMMM